MCEQDIQRGITTAFINTQPIVVTLLPHDKVTTATGGRQIVEGTPREPQTMRLIEPHSPYVASDAQDGVNRRTEFEILAEWDATMAAGDTFEVDGAEWTIDELYFANGWEQRARVTRRLVQTP